jgi:anti-sigma regulatory factor (Ser/Thr protein kinase)
MELKDQILAFAKRHRRFSVSDFLNSGSISITRTYVSKIFSELVSEKKLIRAGQSYKTVYSLPENVSSLGNMVSLRIKNNELKEHEVLETIITKAPFILRLKDNVRSIFDYAFSEMLNNAIEHSMSKFIEIMVCKKDNRLSFEVKDSGIGVFRNVMQQRGLSSEAEAMQDLLKGKTTTAPMAHSGEGIFFTSKIADVFTLDSYGNQLTIDNKLNDIFFGKSEKTIRGTKVTFSVALNSTKHTTDIFGQFQTDKSEPAFDKTEIQIKLYMSGTVHISRSQARRVLSGLEKFKTVILDFDKVPIVGQAFADEVFRVFKSKYPKITIIPTNMNDTVEFMVRRVGK